MATQDDSVANLQKFNANVATTCSQLDDQEARLRSEDDALEKLAREAEGAIDGLNEDLDGNLQELQRATDAAEEALAGVTSAAADIARSRLSAAEDRLEEGQGGLEETRERGQGQLEDGLSNLAVAGFQGHASTLDQVEDELQRVRDESQADFDGLDASFEKFQASVDDVRSETGEAVEEATAGIESDAAGVQDGFTDATSRWNASVDEALRSGCEEVGAELAQAYDGWAEAAGEAADGLAQAIFDAVVAAAEALGEHRYQSQVQALAEALDTHGEALVAEASETVRGLDAGQALTGLLEPMVAELEIVLRVVGQVDELLKVMG